MTESLKSLKKQKLRNNEYYNIQDTFDDLYYKSKNKNDYKFFKLMDLIVSPQNIELAYRNIKKNTGSKTKGVNKHTINDIARLENHELVNYVKGRLSQYQPHPVRRVEIPKPNGKMRPLGIPTIEDRLIQQCIKQVLEPICEAKFYNHSYGFRPNRSAYHAKARAMTLANMSKLHYVVDIDIKGFFDNVNHEKLMKQMWALGIQDKQLLSIIKKMLKAPIEGVGIPTKGTPQGGILSPLLSNIVLNELDWWIASQWECFETKYKYSKVDKKYNALRKTKMKEIYIVRYADDFKIFCRNYTTAKKIFHATKQWLSERLHLDISEEKSKIVNLKNNYSEFLGFRMKIKKKGQKKVVKSHINKKAYEQTIKKLKNQIKQIQKEPSIKNVNKYNSMVLGIHNYYKIATHVNIDFSQISYKLSRTIDIRTRSIQSKTGMKTKCYEKFYGKYNYKTVYINGIALFPIAGITTSPPMNFSQDICNYTELGRINIHKKQQKVDASVVKYLMENPIPNESIEYNDNRISLYIAQGGICAVTGDILTRVNMHCHHKTPKNNGGSDEYENLIYIKYEVHKLIHATNNDTINKYLNKIKPDEKCLEKINKLREQSGNFKIM